MPTQWTLDLALTSALAERSHYDILHSLACNFFEQPDSDHDAEHKPFTIRMDTPTPAGTRLTFAWLPDEPPPVSAVPTTLRLGPHHVEVTGFRTRKTTLEHLGADTPGRRVRFRFVSPTKFRQYGHDYPLPDPHLTYAGLARRYLQVKPGPDDVARELARTVVVYQHNIHTATFTWHGRRSAGFLGTVTFGIPDHSPPAVQRLFAGLNHLATIAGLGHGTTHGLGATDIQTAVDGCMT